MVAMFNLLSILKHPDDFRAFDLTSYFRAPIHPDRFQITNLHLRSRILRNIALLLVNMACLLGFEYRSTLISVLPSFIANVKQLLYINRS